MGSGVYPLHDSPTDPCGQTDAELRGSLRARSNHVTKYSISAVFSCNFACKKDI